MPRGNTLRWFGVYSPEGAMKTSTFLVGDKVRMTHHNKVGTVTGVSCLLTAPPTYRYYVKDDRDVEWTFYEGEIDLYIPERTEKHDPSDQGLSAADILERVAERIERAAALCSVDMVTAHGVVAELRKEAKELRDAS